MKNIGKGEEEKGEIRLKNASLRVKNSKKFRPYRRVDDGRRGKKLCAEGGGGGNDRNV